MVGLPNPRTTRTPNRGVANRRPHIEHIVRVVERPIIIVMMTLLRATLSSRILPIYMNDVPVDLSAVPIGLHIPRGEQASTRTTSHAPHSLLGCWLISHLCSPQPDTSCDSCRSPNLTNTKNGDHQNSSFKSRPNGSRWRK